MAVYKLATDMAIGIFVLDRARSVDEFAVAVFDGELWPEGSSVSHRSPFKTRRAADILIKLAQAGFAETDGQHWKLTPPGRDALRAINEVGLRVFLSPIVSSFQVAARSAESVQDGLVEGGLDNCPRCNQHHVGITFRKLARADSLHTHYTFCPVSGEPIMTRFGVRSSPSAGPVVADNPKPESVV